MEHQAEDANGVAMTKVDRTKSKLGRGLSSLLSLSNDMEAESSLPVMMSVSPVPHVEIQNADTSAPPSRSGDSVQTIALGQIAPNPHQPRRTFEEASLAELAASLKSTGLIQPILVRKAGEGFQLIAGERRLRAAKIAGLESVLAIVRDIDSAMQAQMALVENIQREDLNPIDRAQSYRSLMDQLSLTQAELANRLGEDRSGIANHLRLLSLVEPVREMIRTGRLTFGHAKLLAGVEDMLEQQRVAELVVTGQLSVRQLEQLLQVASEADKPASGPSSGSSAHIRDLEQSLSRQLGMRIEVRGRGKKGAGKLMIHYNSLDQFDELLARMGARVEPS